MEAEKLAELLKPRLHLPLPGRIAHEPMRAVAIGDMTPAFEHKLPPRPGSVLILFYPDDGKIKIPLTKRADYTGAHSGQISLPGGKREGDETSVETALREAHEEIDLDTSIVEVLGRLTDFFVIPSNFMVTPVVGWSKSKPSLTVDNREAIKIIECDLADLISDDAPRSKEILAAKKYRMMAPHFNVEEEIVWGATAMMLNEFRMIVRDVTTTSLE